LDCAKERPTDAGTAVMAAIANARASMTLVNIVILLVAKPESGLCGLDRATRPFIPTVAFEFVHSIVESQDSPLISEISRPSGLKGVISNRKV
jgi:hypothetical protein